MFTLPLPPQQSVCLPSDRDENKKGEAVSPGLLTPQKSGSWRVTPDGASSKRNGAATFLLAVCLKPPSLEYHYSREY